MRKAALKKLMIYILHNLYPNISQIILDTSQNRNSLRAIYKKAIKPQVAPSLPKA